ncbi:hypothetical protein CLAFUW4_08589 [Fulvia fulva]|uniref:F-box domain-containing protein n=1 Tax=Passalora fulva TaxID=5499 RepID=A0A9Q8LD51_PASFU|nr:uncharacterized protein CLAFUR5_08691 [Fulvia fulva]KAK4628989.1 hypothetical protein CLAFUR4_08592 [Fulvia fulva]KAK4630499.1 hypothetical protein CLAFUR0_08587 [Fulvia fulva]UJO15351.1 hypothetical protein CLAFUR5_08691 [Fulvia fulva]WPV12443.1 hypothetical protein CLAFUW4_08589 [Fulvia fulva]WPV27595.1 hypothetical protein CLAFUW7_08587 [Fulvia fulva]
MATLKTANDVFAIREILEQVLSYMDAQELLTVQRISKVFKTTFESSSHLQQLAFLKPTNDEAKHLNLRRYLNGFILKKVHRGGFFTSGGDTSPLLPHWRIRRLDLTMPFSDPRQQTIGVEFDHYRPRDFQVPDKRVFNSGSWRRMRFADPGVRVRLRATTCYHSADMKQCATLVKTLRDDATLGDVVDWLDEWVRESATRKNCVFGGGVVTWDRRPRRSKPYDFDPSEWDSDSDGSDSDSDSDDSDDSDSGDSNRDDSDSDDSNSNNSDPDDSDFDNSNIAI